MKRNTVVSVIVFLLTIVLCSVTLAGEHGKGSADRGKVAIVLASFGTTVPSAIESITNIQQEVNRTFR
jgi:sirohydrochlorin cobaltochelatase